MAKLSPSPIQLKGQIGNLIFSTRNGKPIAYQKPSFCLTKWRKSKTTKWARISAQNFGGAAKCGSALYSALAIGTTKGIFRPYSHNYIAKKLRANVYRSAPAVEHYDLPAAVRALRNLDLSTPQSQSKLINFKQIGPTHCPSQITIQGLREAAYEIDPSGKAHLECRITRRTLHFPEVKYNKDAWEWNRTSHKSIIDHQEEFKSEWFHINHIPYEGIQLKLSTHASEPKQASFVFFIIEWRSSQQKAQPQGWHNAQALSQWEAPKPKYKQLKTQAIIKLAAIRLTIEEAQAIAKAPIPQKRKPKPTDHAQAPAANDLKSALQDIFCNTEAMKPPQSA